MEANTFTPRHLPFGLITKVSEQYYYVWNCDMGTRELRFPNEGEPTFVAGEVCRFSQKVDSNFVQPPRSLFKEKKQLPICPSKNISIPYKIKTTLAFPPLGFTGYDKFIYANENCVAIAFSSMYYKVACFATSTSRFQYQPGGVYGAYITRIPEDRVDSIIPLVDTLFCLVGGSAGLVQLTDEEEIQKAHKHAPWTKMGEQQSQSEKIPEKLYESPASSPDCGRSEIEIGDTHMESEIDEYADEDGTGSSSHRTCQSQEGRGNQSISQPRREPITPKFNQTLLVHMDIDKTDITPDTPVVKPIAEQPRVGIVVRIEHRYVVIWNADDDLVAGVCDNPKALDLATWVRYKSVDAVEEWAEECPEGMTRQAYALQEIDPRRLSAKSHTTLKVQAFLKMHRRLKFNPSGFALAQDDILRFVHVPYDMELINRLEKGDTVEVYAIFMERHMKPSHWIAVVMNIGGEGAKESWKQLEGLSDRMKEYLTVPYTPKASPGDVAVLQQSFSDMQEDESLQDTLDMILEPDDFAASLPYWTAPEGYTGPIAETGKTTSQVLGLVVAHENDNSISVIYTRFGLARLDNYLRCGTWLNMTIYEDDPEIPLSKRQTHADRAGTHYLVRKHERILPPVSTRLIELKGCGDRLLLCGVVKAGDNCWTNDYLGKIDDEGAMIKTTQGASSYLVEMSLFKSKGNYGGLCWRVVKFHGVETPGVNSVPLRLSIAPTQMGRTCDDAHTLRLEHRPYYVLRDDGSSSEQNDLPSI